MIVGEQFSYGLPKATINPEPGPIAPAKYGRIAGCFSFFQSSSLSSRSMSPKIGLQTSSCRWVMWLTLFLLIANWEAKLKILFRSGLLLEKSSLQIKGAVWGNFSFEAVLWFVP